MTEAEQKAEYLRRTKGIDASTDEGLAQIAAILREIAPNSPR